MIPLAAVAACFFVTLFVILRHVVGASGAADPDGVEAARHNARIFTFLPLLAIGLYGALSAAAYACLRVEDPCRDLNFVLARLAPARVIAGSAAKEAYRRAALRTIWLLKTLFTCWILAYQLFVFWRFARGG